MLKKIALTSLLGCVVTCSAYADIQVDGNITANNTKNNSEKIKVNGNAIIKNSLFNTIQIDGSLTSSNSTFIGNIIVNGDFNGQNSKFLSATINGSFNCNTCTFTKDLIISSDTVIFSATKVKNITIHTQTKGLFNSSKTTTLYLKDNSFVEGNITFQNGQGIVYSSTNSKITGHVINGKIVSQ